MKLKPMVAANTLGVIGFVSFALCMIWAAIDRDSFVSFWESWAHGFNLEVLAGDGIGILNAKSTFGLASFTATSWIFGYVTVWLYNKLSKE